MQRDAEHRPGSRPSNRATDQAATQAARLADLQRRRELSAGARRRHPATGSRLAATGLAATAVIGFTGAIAAANRPAPKASAPPAKPLPGTPVVAPTMPAPLPTVVASVVPPPTEPVRAAVARQFGIVASTNSPDTLSVDTSAGTPDITPGSSVAETVAPETSQPAPVIAVAPPTTLKVRTPTTTPAATTPAPAAPPAITTAPTAAAPAATAAPEIAPPATAAPPQTAPPQTAPPQTAPPATAPALTAPPQTAPPETSPPATAPPPPPVTSPSG